MNVIITDQALERLEVSLRFYLDELEIPIEKVLEIKDKLFGRARSLSAQPYRGQYEPYLLNLKMKHRRLIEGNFKIIYRIEDNVIYVVDFFDSRHDPKKMKG